MCGLWIHLVVDPRLRENVVVRENCWAVEVIQNVHDTSSVPVVSHPASIVDVTCSVLQYLQNNNIFLCACSIGLPF